MAQLISCPACGKEVSSQAPSCPNCGNPIATETTGVQSIQATGKSLKLQQLLSVLVVALGVILMIAGSPGSNGEPSGAFTFGTLLLVVGLVWFFVTKFMAWWRHS